MNESGTTKFWLLGIAIIFFSLTLSVGSFFVFEKKYKDKLYPNTYLGEINLGGKTKEEVKKTVNEKINLINQNGIIFKYNSSEITIFPIVTSMESDLAYEIIHFDADNTVNQIFEQKSSTNALDYLKKKISAVALKKKVYLKFTSNDKEIKNIIEQSFSQYHMPAEDAMLIHEEGASSSTIFYVKDENLGKVINSEKAIKTLRNNLANADTPIISLTTETDYPNIYKKDCLNIDKKAGEILALAPIMMMLGEKKWVVEKQQFADWLGLKENKNYDIYKDKIIIGLNEAAVKKFLTDTIATTTDKETIDAKFEMKDGKVVEFRGGQDGIKLDIDSNFQKIEKEILDKKQNSIELFVENIRARNSIGEVNDLGIKEIIGTGVSNFAGSPSNRRHNIRTGANTLNGLIIKPGEEFSLLKALGKIDASTGYLQELVIKDNKTIPEYGGGLCQIGTTAFRATLASGLPVTLRRNHSYRVVYYEPAGTDATIYDPWPDYRFINDTGSHILIQTRIEGDNLYFDFWGTKDGRQVEKTDPIIYNITSPGPTKLIETLDLKPGEKKCTERAHNGADAYFDYKVTYKNGDEKEERFNSHYVPWREVCLIGVEKLTETSGIENQTPEQATTTTSQ